MNFTPPYEKYITKQILLGYFVFFMGETSSDKGQQTRDKGQRTTDDGQQTKVKRPSKEFAERINKANL